MLFNILIDAVPQQWKIIFSHHYHTAIENNVHVNNFQKVLNSTSISKTISEHLMHFL